MPVSNLNAKETQPKIKPRATAGGGQKCALRRRGIDRHVENFAQSSDTDRKNRIRKIVSEPPTVDPKDEWLGDGSSDPD